MGRTRSRLPFRKPNYQVSGTLIVSRPPRYSRDWVWLALSCGLAAFVALTNVYVGLSSGITPNLSLVGVLAAAVLARYWTLGRGTPKDSLNIVQTGASAANSIATGLIFTIPALFVMKDLAAPVPWFSFSLVATGGAAVGLLTVLSMVRLNASSSMTAAPEGDALRALIERAATQLNRSVLGISKYNSWRQWSLLTGLLGGLMAGIAVALNRAAFSIEWSEYRELDLGLNPAWMALGVLVGIRTAKGVFVGAMLKFGLLGVAIGVLSSDAGSLGKKTDELIAGSASVVLGMAAVLTVLMLIRRLATRARETYGATSARKAARREPLPVSLIVLMVVVSVVGLAALGGLNDLENSASGFAAIVLFGLLTALGAAVLAERAVSLVGVTMNPSSGMALLVGAGFALSGMVQFGPLVVGYACFVVCATSASADLAQDLRIGRGLGTPMNSQVSFKWWGLALGAPAAFVLVAALLQSSTIGLPEFEVPQARALEAIFRIASDSGPSLAIGVVACATLLGGFASGVGPIMIGIGMLVKGELTVALFLGAVAGQLMEKIVRKQPASGPGLHRAGAESQSTARLEAAEASVVFAPIVASILGAFAIGSAVVSIWGKTTFPLHAYWLLEIGALLVVGVSFGLGIVFCRKEADSGGDVG